MSCTVLELFLSGSGGHQMRLLLPKNLKDVDGMVRGSFKTAIFNALHALCLLLYPLLNTYSHLPPALNHSCEWRPPSLDSHLTTRARGGTFPFTHIHFDPLACMHSSPHNLPPIPNVHAFLPTFTHHFLCMDPCFSLTHTH